MLFSLECRLSFKSSTINIYSRHRTILVCFSNQNTLTNIGKCHNIAFYGLHCVQMVKTLMGVRPMKESKVDFNFKLSFDFLKLFQITELHAV